MNRNKERIESTLEGMKKLKETMYAKIFAMKVRTHLELSDTQSL